MERRRPPYSDAGEKALLGCILANPVPTFKECAIHRVTPEWFYDPKHRALADYLWNTVEEPLTIDLITVSDGLVDTGRMESCGGSAYVDDLLEHAYVPSDPARYIVPLERDYKRRSMISFCDQALADCWSDTDPEDVISGMHTYCMEASRELDMPRTRKEVIASLFETWRGKNTATRGIIPAWKAVENMLIMLRYGKASVWACRPGGGKSTILGNQITQTALSGIPCAVASIEMDEEEWYSRILCEQADTSSFKMDGLNGTEDDFRELEYASKVIEKAPIYVNDNSSMTIEEFERYATYMATEKGVKLIGLDYLQILSPSGTHQSRDREISHWMNCIRRTAKRLNIHIMVLSQLSRVPKGQKATRPTLRDLRDSGSIEQDAYVVAFLWKDDGVDKLNIAKHRGGPTGDIKLKFFRNRQRWADALAVSDEDEDEEAQGELL